MKRMIVFFIILLITACGSSEWKATSAFFVQEGDHYISLIGPKSKLGLKIDEPFMKNKDVQTAWYLWDAEGEYITIKATHKETDREAIVIESATLQSTKQFGANRVYTAPMTFEESGKWRIDILTDNELFASIVVEVQ
ncbi:hypothetical protein EJF36_18540 [Bacillus sp. HMF5848]|uniref:hypothetical protein n=1 Tax=Bacillus sp. HMF5848 TaxID=2495421 RepID=UPI000F77F9D7|nr:hypothetical protein [Bacillus sp. HMF5848]RSK28708.1 hypothetical protein EJF36_18540 [Bacillus sp. HMF5848]